MSKNTLIMLMGPAGISKKVVADKVRETHEDCLVIKSDAEDYFERIETSLRINAYTVIDGDYTTVEAREKFFKNTRIPSNTKIVGVWIESSLNAAKKNNKTLPAQEQVPEKTLEKMFKYKVSPLEYEPFNQVLFLNPEQDIAIYKNTAMIRSVLDTLTNL